MTRVIRWRTLGVVVLLACVIVAFAALAWGTFRPVPGHSVLGAPAPALTIKTFDGRTLSLQQLRGKPVVLNFWASWCVPCHQEQKALNTWAQIYGQRLSFVGVDIRDAEPAARSYLADERVQYVTGTATTGSYHDFGVQSPPDTFFIDRSGTIVARYTGALDNTNLDLYIGQVL
jgi:cytochrome c biogenesis protein CcmG/thiol:disulfide interchange protein DsbE